MPLQRQAQSFDDPDWLFELKYDGFRALAHVGDGRCAFVSRNGHRFGSWPDLAEDIGAGLHGRNLVIDGEIVCLDERGHPQSTTCSSGAELRITSCMTCCMTDGQTDATTDLWIASKI